MKGFRSDSAPHIKDNNYNRVNQLKKMPTSSVGNRSESHQKNYLYNKNSAKVNAPSSYTYNNNSNLRFNNYRQSPINTSNNSCHNPNLKRLNRPYENTRVNQTSKMIMNPTYQCKNNSFNNMNITSKKSKMLDINNKNADNIINGYGNKERLHNNIRDANKGNYTVSTSNIDSRQKNGYIMFNRNQPGESYNNIGKGANYTKIPNIQNNYLRNYNMGINRDGNLMQNKIESKCLEPAINPNRGIDPNLIVRNNINARLASDNLEKIQGRNNIEKQNALGVKMENNYLESNRNRPSYFSSLLENNNNMHGVVNVIKNENKENMGSNSLYFKNKNESDIMKNNGRDEQMKNDNTNLLNGNKNNSLNIKEKFYFGNQSNINENIKITNSQKYYDLGGNNSNQIQNQNSNNDILIKMKKTDEMIKKIDNIISNKPQTQIPVTSNKELNNNANNQTSFQKLNNNNSSKLNTNNQNANVDLNNNIKGSSTSLYKIEDSKKDPYNNHISIYNNNSSAVNSFMQNKNVYSVSNTTPIVSYNNFSSHSKNQSNIMNNVHNNTALNTSNNKSLLKNNSYQTSQPSEQAPVTIKQENISTKLITTCFKGLVNLGNTCYVNTCIQNLIHCTPFIEKLFEINRNILQESNNTEMSKTNTNVNKNNLLPSTSASEASNSSGNTNKKITKAFMNLCLKLSQCKAYASPNEFINTFIKCHDSFNSYAQHDTVEFCRNLLDDLSKENNRITNIPKYKELKTENKSKAQIKKEYNQMFKEREDSLIVDLFYGQIVTTHRCQECGFETFSFENFLDIPLLIQEEETKDTYHTINFGNRNYLGSGYGSYNYGGYSNYSNYNNYSYSRYFNNLNKVIDLMTLFDAYFKKEVCKWEKNCEKCQGKTYHEKQPTICTLPNILIISIQRYNIYTNKKKSDNIKFYETIDLKKYLDCDYIKQNPNTMYKLFGVSNHYGTMDFGHYFAVTNVFYKDSFNWLMFNDEDVTLHKMSFEGTYVYCLFYIRNDLQL